MSKFNEVVREARDEVDSAIEALEAMPMSFGGHLAKHGSSVIDGSWTDATLILFDKGWRRLGFKAGDEVVHDDGRKMTFDRFLDPVDTPYLTALVTDGGETWRVVPAHKLRSAR